MRENRRLCDGRRTCCMSHGTVFFGKEGTYIYDTCIARGLAGLLEWRAGSSLSLGQMTKRRIAQVAEQRLQKLAETTLKEIVHRIEQVHSATVDADVPLPFNRLLKSPPSSLERRRLSRRLSFGVSALINRSIHRQGSQQTKRKR